MVRLSVKEIVIVLGDRPEGDSPTSEMVRRVRHGVQVAKRLESAAIIFSGGRTSGRYSESHLMHGIAEEEFPEFTLPAMLESRSLDTIGNAYYSGRLLESVRHEGLCLVTSPYHIERAEYIFGRVIGGQITADTYGKPPALRSPSEEEAWELARVLLEGIRPGDLDAAWSRMITMHPYYSTDKD